MSDRDASPPEADDYEDQVNLETKDFRDDF
jgi:hypothetical protein